MTKWSDTNGRVFWRFLTWWIMPLERKLVGRPRFMKPLTSSLIWRCRLLADPLLFMRGFAPIVIVVLQVWFKILFVLLLCFFWGGGGGYRQLVLFFFKFFFF